MRVKTDDMAITVKERLTTAISAKVPAPGENDTVTTLAVNRQLHDYFAQARRGAEKLVAGGEQDSEKIMAIHLAIQEVDHSGIYAFKSPF
jgi:type VII secretion effector (TIGR04197 family)